jgi:predicted metalloprotease with PDZ domain
MQLAYRVTLDPDRHQLQVELDIQDLSPCELSLLTPTWVPGDYEFQTYGRDVFAVRATDPSSGRDLRVRRNGWSGYTVEQHRGALHVRYRASAASVDFSEACGVLGDTNGVLLGTRYLHVAAQTGACSVRYQVPDGWAIHHPAGAAPLGDNTWRYADYAQLLDTPVCFGHFERITRQVRGTTFHHVFLTRAVGFDTGVQRFLDALEAVAEAYFEMFGAFPFEDYTYVLSFNPNDSWGLEHLSGTMVGLDPATFYDADQYKISIRVCAHELFHAWNVRRLRPAPLGHLHWQCGCFSEGLWVAEGFTRYYEFLVCTRTGVYSPAQFFSAVVNYYTHLAALPAYAQVSPVDASSASYLNHDKYPGRANSAIDYYDAGMVIAFETDAQLRTLAAPSASLDSAFAAFYSAYAGKGAGYGVEQICSFFDERLPGLGARLHAQATLPGRLALPDVLQQLGFQVDIGDVPYLGLILSGDSGPGIDSVLDGSPASGSGLAAEDVIVAVDGYPFSPQALAWAAAHPGQVRLDVLRGNQPHRYSVTPSRRTTLTGLRWAGSAAQAQAIAHWLRSAFAPTQDQAIALEFYENFHGIETVL